MVDGVSSRRRGARPRHSLGVVRHSRGWGGAGQPPCWCWPHGHQCGVGCDTGPMTWGCSRRPGRGGRGRGGGGVPAGQDVVAGVTQDVMRFAGQFAGHSTGWPDERRGGPGPGSSRRGRGWPLGRRSWLLHTAPSAERPALGGPDAPGGAVIVRGVDGDVQSGVADRVVREVQTRRVSPISAQMNTAGVNGPTPNRSR